MRILFIVENLRLSSAYNDYWQLFPYLSKEHKLFVYSFNACNIDSKNDAVEYAFSNFNNFVNNINPDIIVNSAYTDNKLYTRIQSYPCIAYIHGRVNAGSCCGYKYRIVDNEFTMIRQPNYCKVFKFNTGLGSMPDVGDTINLRAIKPDRFIIGSHSRYSKVQMNIRTLLRLLVELRKEINVSMVLIGSAFSEGSMKLITESVLNKEENNALNDMIILGDCDREATLKVVSGLDCWLSNSYFEGFPVSVLEAAYYKVPIVVAKVGELSKIFKDESVLFVDDRDNVSSYAKNILSILRRRIDIASMTNSAYDDVVGTKYNYKEFIKILEEVINDK